jgi:hypothetical protein
MHDTTSQSAVNKQWRYIGVWLCTHFVKTVHCRKKDYCAARRFLKHLQLSLGQHFLYGHIFNKTLSTQFKKMLACIVTSAALLACGSSCTGNKRPPVPLRLNMRSCKERIWEVRRQISVRRKTSLSLFSSLRDCFTRKQEPGLHDRCVFTERGAKGKWQEFGRRQTWQDVTRQKLSQFPVTMTNSTIPVTDILSDLLTSTLFNKTVSSTKVLYQTKC